MKQTIIVLTIFFSTSAYSRKPSSVEYNCKFVWKTLTEGPIEKVSSFRDSVDVKINQTLSVKLNAEGDSPKISITEKYSDQNDKSYLQYNFQCNRFYNCNGSRVSMYEGKADKTKMDIGSQNSVGSGSIEKREVFVFKRLEKRDFEFQYVLYRDEEQRPMGLTVTCHE